MSLSKFMSFNFQMSHFKRDLWWSFWILICISTAIMIMILVFIFREWPVVWVGLYASSGLLGPDCAGRPKIFVTKSIKLSAVDVTAKVIYELLVLGPGRFALCHHTLCAHTPTSLSLTISQSPRLSFRPSVLDPPFFCQRFRSSSLVESRYPRSILSRWHVTIPWRSSPSSSWTKCDSRQNVIHVHVGPD